MVSPRSRPIRQTRYRDWFFGLSVPAFVLLSLLYCGVGFGLVLMLFFGPPYDAGSVLPFVGGTLLMTVQGLRHRQRYRQQHGLDEA